MPQGLACIVGLTAQRHGMNVAEARLRALPASMGQDITQESAQVSEERRVPGAQATEVQ